ncbi:MAG: pantoate--beta-alanine ligase [Saprospiraceae bacterium]
MVSKIDNVMKIIETVKDIQTELNDLKARGKTIGFSPTMGAFHKGHVSLIDQCKKKDDISVCSIFINPTQFNDQSDLEKYPRTLEADIKILEEIECNILFAPSVEEMYPPDFTSFSMNLNGLDNIMEGEKRPGHFAGMIEVIHRLLEIIDPHHIYMGQKDFQQFTIVDYMLKTQKITTKLVVCPIIREDDGLAMSSRNIRLEKHIRSRASHIYYTLKASQDWLKCIPIKYSIEKAMNALDILDFKPEYFEIVNGYSLQPVEDYRNTDYVVGCTAVWAGNVRLIDNIIYKKIS